MKVWRDVILALLFAIAFGIAFFSFGYILGHGYGP